MLPRENRLKKKKDFENVFKQGRGFKEDFLFLKFAKNNSKTTRFGFVVGQKVSKKATTRNRVKRKLRELTAGVLGNIEKGFDTVIVAEKGAERAGDIKTKEVFNKLFKKSRLLHD